MVLKQCAKVFVQTHHGCCDTPSYVSLGEGGVWRHVKSCGDNIHMCSGALATPYMTEKDVNRQKLTSGRFLQSFFQVSITKF